MPTAAHSNPLGVDLADASARALIEATTSLKRTRNLPAASPQDSKPLACSGDDFGSNLIDTSAVKRQRCVLNANIACYIIALCLDLFRSKQHRNSTSTRTRALS